MTPKHHAATGPAPHEVVPRWWLERVRSPVTVATAVAIILTAAYLLAAPMGADLSAQLERASFAGRHPLGLLDLRWFGGTLPFGYSLWVPALMAVVGVRVTGAIATVAGTWLFTRLIANADAPRPAWGGVAAAITLTENLAEGRVTFACGVACGLGALVALSSTTASRGSRWTVAVALAVLAGGASPVVSLLLVVCAVALAAMRRFVDAITLLTSILSTAVISLLFADGGDQVFSANDAIRALLASALVVAVLPGRRLMIRIGAGIGLVMVAAAWLLPTPVGSNATRLSLLFAVPVVAAFMATETGRRRALVPLAVLITVLVQPPVVWGTLTGAGKPVTHAAYFQPLLNQLKKRGPLTGRLEIPELTGHWDAAYVAPTVALARGWLRQTDTKLNSDVFYDKPPTPATYRAFLNRNAVQYVAVADARATFYGRREASLIRGTLPYLKEVWRDPHWTLYAVSAAKPIVAAPAKLVRYDSNRIVLTAPAHAKIVLRMRWFRWLDVDGVGSPCLLRLDAQTVELRTGNAGQYIVHASIYPLSQHCS